MRTETDGDTRTGTDQATLDVPRRPEAARQRVTVAALLLALVGLLVLSLCAGDPWLRPGQLWQGLTSELDGADPTLALLIRYARMPRIVLALLVGGALAVAGLLMQTLSRNPLATPSLLGVGNGANFGLVLAIVTVPGLSELTAVSASFLGAVGSAAIVALMGLSGGTRLDRDRLVVGGTILGTLEGSLVVGILFFAGMRNVMLGWTLGRLVHVDWMQVWFIAPVLVAGILLGTALMGKLEAFRLGQHTAQGLGVGVGPVQLGVLFAVVLLAGGSIAAAGPIAFIGLIVPHLVGTSRLRDPRLRLLACLPDDWLRVQQAIRAVGIEDLAERPVQTLSGGQRQRAWIAMPLAQETELILLDEPTTFLDLGHQVEILNLLRRLNQQQGKTIVMALHDLNLAARYADFMIVVSDGGVLAADTPERVLTPEILSQAFGLDVEIIRDPRHGTPMCVVY